MEDLVNIFVKSVFIDNMIFAYFLGMCSYLAVSKTVKTAVGLGAAVIFVLGITVPINYLLENYVLKSGALGRKRRPIIFKFYHVHCSNRFYGSVG